MLRHILIGMLCFSPVMAIAQNSFFTIGYNLEKYKNTDPFQLAFDDFNAYFSQPGHSLDLAFNSPEISRGLTFGIKSNSKWISSGMDLHFRRLIDKAIGYDSLGNEYYRKIKLTHNGFSFFLNLNIIHAEKFRVGPGFSFNMEQYFSHVKRINNWTYGFDNPTDKFLLSGSARLMISFGGEKFNFDLVPFYTLPFWKVNVAAFNEAVNYTTATTYTKEQMTFNPEAMGIIMSCCFSF